MRNLTETLEAIVFASGKSIKKSDILDKLPDDVSRKDLNDAIAKLSKKYNGDSGILFLAFEDKMQFSTNPLYGDIVTEILTPLKEKELSKTLLEVLSIIAYKQPVTRLEIENIRGVNCDYALSTLGRVNLIEVVGRKDTVGRPSLYGTTEEFLKKFQLSGLEDLPEYSEVLNHLKDIYNVTANTDSLFRKVDDITVNDSDKVAADDLQEAVFDNVMDTDEIPDFLEGEDFKVIE